MKKYVSFSGGKDSLVVLHRMLKEWDKNFDVIYIDTSIALPECNEYVSKICKEWNLNLIVLKPEKDFWEHVKTSGFPRTVFPYRWCVEALKMRPLKKFLKDKQGSLEALGIRKLESNDRKERYKETIYWDERGGIWRYYPILYWTDDQINNYIKSHNLPVNPCYAIYGENGSCYFCPFIKRPKYYLTLRKNHPELFNKIIEAEKTMKKGGSALWKKGKPLHMKRINEQHALEVVT